MKKIFLLVSSLLLLCSCSSNDTKKSNVSNDSNESSIGLISIDTLEDDVEKALKKTPTNFILSDNINVELPDKYYECNFKQVSGFDSNYSEIFNRYFDESEYADIEILDETYQSMHTYSFQNDDYYCCVGDSGFVSFYRPSAGDKLFGGGKRVKIYHLNRDEEFSDSYELADGKTVSVAQAAEFAQNWIDENYADYESDYKITVKTIIAREGDDGVMSYDIYAEKKYNGIALDNLKQMTGEMKIGNDVVAYIKYNTQDLYMQMFNSDEIGSFTNGNGIISPVDEEELAEIVSLSGAIDSIEETFTDFNEPMTINDINLKYTLSPIYDYGNTHASYFEAGLDITGNLVWEFVIDLPENEYPSGEEGDIYGNIQKYIYVDAQTGEIDYEFEINNLLQ